MKLKAREEYIIVWNDADATSVAPFKRLDASKYIDKYELRTIIHKLLWHCHLLRYEVCSDWLFCGLFNKESILCNS